MTRQLGNLGDFLPDKEMRCRIRGCNNIWTLDGQHALSQMAAAEGAPERMCEACFERFKTLQDQEVPCANPDCANNWTWNRYQQLESKAQGYDSPPRRFCDQCRQKTQEIEDKDVPCRLRGCSNTWSWSSRQQLSWRGDSPPPRFCESCYQRLNQLQDQEIPCRMKSCPNSWTWNRYQQLQHEKEGKDLDKPPRRMCEACFEKLQGLEDKERPCKVTECSRTWTFSVYAQLENILKNGEDAEPPDRMCEDCFNFYKNRRDVERKCRNRGCPNRWTYTRAWQLHDWLKGRDYAPALMCDECKEKLQGLEERAVECSIPGCDGVWTYTPEDQLKDQCAGRLEPKPHRCHDCEVFLAEHESIAVPCRQCGEPINWSPYEQLLTERGTFVKPEVCAGCAEKELAKRAGPAPPPPEHHHVVRMPAGGKWGSDPKIAAWPPHLDYRAIEKAENADLRIVALGDDLTFSSDSPDTAWPAQLELKLNQKLEEEGLSVAVINAGIPGTTSRQAVKRLPRDVAPFAPHLVIFSFAFGDSYIEPRADGSWRERTGAELAEKATEDLCRHLKRLGASLLYWTTNPQFPHDKAENASDGGDLAQWANEQKARKNRILAHALHVCSTQDVPVIDLRSRFEVNGKKSAQKWMADWYRQNDMGAQNIATWMASYILQKSLLPYEMTVRG